MDLKLASTPKKNEKQYCHLGDNQIVPSFQKPLFCFL